MLMTSKSQAKLNKLRNSMNWCCINISSDYHYMWTVELIRARSKTHTVDIASYHEDLNVAINDICKKAQLFLEKETK